MAKPLKSARNAVAIWSRGRGELEALVVGDAFGDAADEGAQAGVSLGEFGGCLGFPYGLVPEVDEELARLALLLEHRDEVRAAWSGSLPRLNSVSAAW
jgi:hypothetical protein